MMMKKALQAGFSAMLFAAIAPAQAGIGDLFAHSALYATGTYSKPSENGLSFGNVVDANTYTHVFVKPNYEFDYGLGAVYRLPQTQTHLFFDYDHYNNDKSESAENVTGLGFVGAATAKVMHRNHASAFGFSHLLFTKSLWSLHVSSFFEWDRFRREFSETVEDGIRLTEDKVRGYGPGFGALLHVQPFARCPNFGLFSGITAAWLYAHNDYRQFCGAAGNKIEMLQISENTRSVFTKLKINFGVNYTGYLEVDGRNKLKMEVALGMRYMNAINVFKNGNTFFNEAGTNHALNTGRPEDFGRMGPYLQFQIGGAQS